MTNVGTVNHGGTDVYKGMTDEFDQLKGQLDDINSKMDEIKNSNLPDSKKQEMLDQLKQQKKAVKKGLDYVTESGKYDTTAGSTKNDADLAAINNQINSANAALRDVEMQMDMATRGTQRPHDGCCCKAPPSGGGQTGRAGRTGGGGQTNRTSGGGQTNRTSGGGQTNQTSNSGQTQGGGQAQQTSGSGGGGGGMMGTDLSMDDAVSMMQNDPEALLNKLNDMDYKKAQMMMQAIQQQMQQMQQMMKMMSNLSKTMHQTKMGTIRNM